MQPDRPNFRTVLARSKATDWTRYMPPSWAIASGAGLLLILGVYWYFFTGSSNEVAYTTRPVTRGDVVVTVRATGTIEPVDQVEISSELSGTMRFVDVDFNDVVKKGQILARLDTEAIEAQIASARATLAAREARVRETSATLAETRSSYNRAKSLHERQFLSAAGLEQARAAFERAEASLGSAKADVLTARADLKVKETNLGKANIRSPINGVVLDRNVEPGQTVASSLQAPVLFKIAQDLKDMQLEVDIDEADVAQVQTGDRATFWVEGLPERTFPARISDVHYSSRTIEGVVTYKAVLTIENTDLLLRPGMTATADIRVEEVTGADLVPNAALRFTPPESTNNDSRSWLQRLMPRGPGRNPNQARKSPGTGKTVWILVGGQAVERSVLTGLSDGSNTVIKGGELKQGDQVIVDADTGG